MLDKRRARSLDRPLFAGYPAPLRRLLFWYDTLSDWQCVKYAIAASLFLVACGGYLLGLGSTMVVQRVDAEETVLAAAPLPSPEVPTPTALPVVVAAPPATPTSTAEPSPTATPTPQPTQTPFTAPQIAEPPAAPRSLPANPPAAPVRATATPDKPRNLETSKPESPGVGVGTPAAGTGRPAPTAVRQGTPASNPALRTTPNPRTPQPTLGLLTTPRGTVQPALQQSTPTSLTLSTQPAPALQPTPAAAPTRPLPTSTPLLIPPTPTRTPAVR